MATLASRLSDFAGAVRDKFNAITPRLWPAGSTPFVPARGVSFGALVQQVASQEWSTVAPYAATFVTANVTAKARKTISAASAWAIQKNGAQVGTVTFSAGTKLGVVSLSGGTFSVAYLDELAIVAPATVDGSAPNSLAMLFLAS